MFATLAVTDVIRMVPPARFSASRQHVTFCIVTILAFPLESKAARI